MKLLSTLATEIGRDPIGAVIATVSQVGNYKVDVLVNGTTIPNVPVADCYPTPSVGDTVVIVKIGAAWLALTSLGGAGPELVANGTFDDGTPTGLVPPSWEALSSATPGMPVATTFEDSAVAHSGTKVLRMPYGTAGQRVMAGNQIAVTPGSTFRASAYVRASRDLRTSLNEYVDFHVWTAADFQTDRSSGLIGSVDYFPIDIPDLLAADGWVALSGQFTVPAGHFWVWPEVTFQAISPTLSGYVYVDDVSIRAV